MSTYGKQRSAEMFSQVECAFKLFLHLIRSCKVKRDCFAALLILSSAIPFLEAETAHDTVNRIWEIRVGLPNTEAGESKRIYDGIADRISVTIWSLKYLVDSVISY